MNPANEYKIEKLKKDLSTNQFYNENSSSLNNSIKFFKTKREDSIYKNNIFASSQKSLYYNIYFALLYLIYIFIVAKSCTYYFSYNNYNNRIF